MRGKIVVWKFAQLPQVSEWYSMTATGASGRPMMRSPGRGRGVSGPGAVGSKAWGPGAWANAAAAGLEIATASAARRVVAWDIGSSSGSGIRVIGAAPVATARGSW